MAVLIEHVVAAMRRSNSSRLRVCSGGPGSTGLGSNTAPNQELRRTIERSWVICKIVSLPGAVAAARALGVAQPPGDQGRCAAHQHQQLARMHGAKSQQHPLQLTAREFAEQAAAQMAHLQTLQSSRNGLAVVTTWAATEPYKFTHRQREAAIDQQLLRQISHLIANLSGQATTAGRMCPNKRMVPP